MNRHHFFSLFLLLPLLLAACQASLRQEAGRSPKFGTGCANPVLDHHYTADPTAVEYEGRLYLYATNDHQQYDSVGPDGRNTYQHIRSLVVASTDDMVNWTYHGTIDVGSIAPWSMASWAPSIVSRREADGLTHFYLYYSNSGAGVGVLTATSPLGPWSDPLGRTLVDGNTPGLGQCKAPFDPGVVIDDDGCGWLSFGGGDSDSLIPGDARIARLGADMMSLDGPPVEIKAPYHFEANELNYLNGTWIYTYNNNWKPRTRWPYEGTEVPSACSMSYMTSRTPLQSDSWHYVGHYFKNPGDYGMSHSNNHTHLHRYGGRYYLFYHTLGLQESLQVEGGFRSVCVDEIEVDESHLLIHMGQATAAGVSQLKPLDAFTLQQASTTAATHAVRFLPADGAGHTVATACAVGAATEVRGVQFGRTARSVALKVWGTGTLEVRSSAADGSLLASVPFSTDSWQVVRAECSVAPADASTLYFVWREGDFRFDEWQFFE